MLFQRILHSPVISIHALREESDALAQRRDVTASISIHALREEDDGFVPFYR